MSQSRLLLLTRFLMGHTEWGRIAIALIAIGTLLVTCLSVTRTASATDSMAFSALYLPQAHKSHSTFHRTPYFANLYESNKAGPGNFPMIVDAVPSDDLCSVCACDVTPPFYAPLPAFSDMPPRPLEQHVWPDTGSIDLNEFMRLTLLDMYCARQHLTSQQALRLLRRTVDSLGQLMSWSLSALELEKPTIYITTITSPGGNTGAERPQYFRRHGRALRSWITKQTANSTQQADWQVVWIVAEDDGEIDSLVARTLRRTRVPYVYFAYGLTKAWGNAQKNAVLQVVYAMSRPRPRGLFRHGPVYGLDDDNKLLPDLLDILIGVQRVGVFPVGNFPHGGWESPAIDEKTGFVAGSTSPLQGRKFAFDYGAYAFNSSLLGTMISGPSFWKHTSWAGETEFLEQVASTPRDLELLCGVGPERQCHYVWHNEELKEIEKMTDEEEIAFVRQYGAKKLFAELGYGTRESSDAGKTPETALLRVFRRGYQKPNYDDA